MNYLPALLLGLTLAAAPAAPPAETTVAIKDDAFQPARVTITAGTSVAFVNRDDDAHTVTATSGAFDSKGLDTGAVWHHTFDRPGTYTYFCELHPFMHGTIIVKARS